MAYDEHLALRVRAALADKPDLLERKMFGGLAFMLQGHMCCGILHDELIIRVGPQQYASALARPFTREFDFTGRPMTGMVVVSREGIAADSALRAWIERGVQFVSTLPAREYSAGR